MFLCLCHVLYRLWSCSTAEQGSLVPPDGSATAAGPTTAPTAAQQQRVPIHKPFTQSRLPPDLPMHPAPRHITEEELRVLEGCLHRWRSEVENDTRGKTDLCTLTHSEIRQGWHVRWQLVMSHNCWLSCRSTGQYIQNPQNNWDDVLWQVYDAGEQQSFFCSLKKYRMYYMQYYITPGSLLCVFEHLRSPLCGSRFHTGFMLCWSTKVRPMQATTGPTSTTRTSGAGWSTMTSLSPSRPGRSWSGTRLEGTAMPAPTASCTSMTRSLFS